VDRFSDYDVIVAVADPAAYAADLRWHEGVGRPMAQWGDEGEILGVPDVLSKRHLRGPNQGRLDHLAHWVALSSPRGFVHRRFECMMAP
jgi:hypothetical protein